MHQNQWDTEQYFEECDIIVGQYRNYFLWPFDYKDWTLFLIHSFLWSWLRIKNYLLKLKLRQFQFFWVWFGSGLVPNFEKDLVMVWFWILRLSFSLVLLCFDRTRKPFFKNFATFFSIFFKFLKKIWKFQYKNTFNQTKIRISQNLMFKNNNNIIFRQFENILYFEIFKCLVLGLVRFGLFRKVAVWFSLSLNFSY